jgi:hypothetical protein
MIPFSAHLPRFFRFKLDFLPIGCIFLSQIRMTNNPEQTGADGVPQL